MIATDDVVELVNLATATDARTALPLAERAYSLQPDLLAVKIAYAVALQNNAFFEEAIPVFQAAIVQNKSSKEASDHIHSLLLELHLYCLIATRKYDVARRVLNANRPLTDSSDIFTQAHAMLGDWAKGFSLYGTVGTMMLGVPAEQTKSANKWKGEDLTGKRAVVVRGAGYGDYFMFARFFHLLKTKFHAKELVLCGGHSGQEHWAVWPYVQADGVITYDDILPDDIIVFDQQNMWEGITNEDVHDLRGYTYMRQPYKPQDFARRAPFCVGVVWAGNKSNGMDHWRSMSLTDLAPLLAVPCTAWYSFQIGGSEALQTSKLGHIIEDVTPKIGNWRDTAAYLGEIDLLVSVDSAVNHLAGAMGVPTIVLNHKITDWRYGHGDEHTLWHRNHFVCWQKEQGNWTHCVHRARDVLAKAVENKLNG